MFVSSFTVKRHSNVGCLKDLSASSARPAATPMPLSAPKVVPSATCAKGTGPDSAMLDAVQCA